jgi:N-methylhydantoinase A/oxoprolinase/acetone carboxylase beta subunit
MSGPVRVGVDIGGTFTDLLAMDERSGRTFVLKQPSTASPVEAVVDGIRALGVRRGRTDGLDQRDILTSVLTAVWIPLVGYRVLALAP